MNDNLTTYLNDHLAGSVGALELIDDLISASDDASLKLFLANLKCDIEADQKILEGLLEAANEGQSAMRKAAAWVSEKFAGAKFKVAGENLGGLGLVQAFEMLALGIRGKELLWRAVASSNSSSLRDIDFAKLEQRAVEQQKRVEEKRLEAARAAFS
jgi:hypothetical protein